MVGSRGDKAQAEIVMKERDTQVKGVVLEWRMHGILSVTLL